MESIVKTNSGFDEYSKKTENLLLGSRDGQSKHQSINVNTVLDYASKKYPELKRAYAELSETAHPNRDGLSYSYSIVTDKGMNTKFTDNVGRVFKDSQTPLISLLCLIFENEYNDSWINAFDAFEAWIEANDSQLEGSI